MKYEPTTSGVKLQVEAVASVMPIEDPIGMSTKDHR
jgi:hypothetical protein